MSVWLTIPSKRSAEQVAPVLVKWREMGYYIALFRDDAHELYGKGPIACDYLDGGIIPYLGYAATCNRLIREIIANDTNAEWFICAGDDTLPDPNKTAEQIAFECADYFHMHHVQRYLNGEGPDVNGSAATFGVMQPTGDRWGEDDPTNRNLWPNAPANIDRVAGSPWIGREFARRMYQGQGPYWPEYTHQFVDEELQAVAVKMGVFWQRRDLIHYHDHWGRPRKGERMGLAERMPAFLAEANSPEHWKRAKQIFENRRVAGFPGHEAIP